MSFHIKIGNYRFSKNLGTGSFGKVKLAFNEVTGHKVAIKILNKKKIKQQGVFEKVKREIKVLRLFNHPHIIKHYEFIDTPSDIFMVIEYASGGELFELISRRERLEEDEARRFFQQIFSSVEYTHAHKISHRDLKPENLLLDGNNNIKLIDFGLANSMKDSQALKTACGSPNYAAPEVISGRPYSGVEVDVWSMGIILFAMVCGSLPFDDDSMTQLFNKIKEGKFTMPNYISNDVKDLINRMLQPNPVKRITMKEIRDHPWYLKDLPVYLQELSLMHVKKQQEVDLEIVKKIFTYSINLQGKTQEEVVKAIKDKKNTDFCGIYELLFHDRMKKECFDEIRQQEQSAQQKKFKTLKSLFIKASQSEESKQPLIYQTSTVYQTYNQQCDRYTLLTEKHNDRLTRLQKNFRIGYIVPKKLSKQGKQDNSQEVIPLNRGANRIFSVSTQIDTVAHNSSQTVMRNNFFQNDGTKGTQDEQSEQLFQKLDNVQNISKIQNLHKNQWTFGVNFIGNPTDMLNLICDILKKLDIEWQLIPKDLKMKCRSRIDENSLSDYEHLIRDGNVKDEMIKEFLKKNFVKFYINIYKDTQSIRSASTANGGGSSRGSGANTPNQNGVIAGADGEKYMLDVHLFKGTVFVFMDFAKRFIEELRSSCLCISRPSTHSHNTPASSEKHLQLYSPVDINPQSNNGHPQFYANLKLLI